MTQSYYPISRRTSPVKESFTDLGAEKQLKVEDVQEAYVEHKERLVAALDSTQNILSGLQDFNKQEWIVRYPHLREKEQEPEEPSTPAPRRRKLRRSLTFADDPNTETEVVLGTRQGLHRALTLASVSDAPEDQEEFTEGEKEAAEGDRLIPPSDASDFQVLRLDLKLGPHGSSTSPASLVSQLEKSSISNLLDERIGASVKHINKLRLRVEDTSSKVLVTGDLNAGKSTFVNALLRREIMPVDQQPCTTAFCEVHDAAENDGKEEVHILKDGVPYSIDDESTFIRGEVEDLEQIVGDNEEQPMLKVYLADTRAPSESLLNNGVVDISLIDAPGLNRDSIKTTAVFARQEEIDVVVFVVSAENHFTLSAKEFLQSASSEKAYLFIVVNKYEQIRNKEKCRRLVLEQIKELSPRTYEDADDLVHFVDSAAALRPFTANPAFDDLESSLRSFVLVKRSKSKLQPASTYLSNLLADIDLLSGANAIVAQAEFDRTKEDLNRTRPVLDKMRRGHDDLQDGLNSVEEEGANKANWKAKQMLTDALERVAQGKLGVDHPEVTMPSYPGVLGIWDYTRDVRKALVRSIDFAVKLAEDEARLVASTGVKEVSQLADRHLPEGVERSRRIFMPQAMFSTVRNARRGRRASAVVAGGMHGLGIGLAQRPDMLETTFFDLFDVNHQFMLYFEDGNDQKEANPTALSVVSVGLGALTLVGGQAIGVRGLIEGIVRVADLLGNKSARGWVGPVVCVTAVCVAAYGIYELPHTVPRTVGRRIKVSLVKLDEGVPESESFVNVHSIRISRETRKVLRLAAWDLRERFRTAFEESSKEVAGAEELQKKAKTALDYFRGVEEKTGQVRESAGLVGAV